MNPTYGFAGCYKCAEIVPIAALNEISVAPSFGDDSEGPSVPAFVCDGCDGGQMKEMRELAAIVTPTNVDIYGNSILPELSEKELALLQGPTS